MLLDLLIKKLRYCCGIKITSLFIDSGVTRGVHEKSGGFVNTGGWGTRKLA